MKGYQKTLRKNVRRFRVNEEKDKNQRRKISLSKITVVRAVDVNKRRAVRKDVKQRGTVC